MYLLSEAHIRWHTWPCKRGSPPTQAAVAFRLVPCLTCQLWLKTKIRPRQQAGCGRRGDGVAFFATLQFPDAGGSCLCSSGRTPAEYQSVHGKPAYVACSGRHQWWLEWLHRKQLSSALKHLLHTRPVKLGGFEGAPHSFSFCDET